MDLFRSSVEKSEIANSDEGKVNCPSVIQLLGGNQSLALASSYEALTAGLKRSFPNAWHQMSTSTSHPDAGRHAFLPASHL